MGKGLVYRCPVCAFQKEYPVGCGFMSPLEAATERENILAGIYGPKPKTALVAHPEAPVEVEHALFQCGACGKLESRLAVTIKAAVRVQFTNGVSVGKSCTGSERGKIFFAPNANTPLKQLI